MIASFRAELLKLGKRPAVWVLGSLSVLSVFVLTYLSAYTAFVAPDPADVAPRHLQLPNMLPGSMVGSALSNFFGDPLGLIIGPLVAGSEYGWGTLKTAFVQRPSRLAVYAGQVLALGAVLAVIVLALFATAAASSYVIGDLQGEYIRSLTPDDVAEVGSILGDLTAEQQAGESRAFLDHLESSLGWPPLSQVAGGFAAVWLILAMWSAFGMLLATLFRSAPIAIGVAFVYLFVVEGLIREGLEQSSGVAQALARALPGTQTISLATSITATSWNTDIRAALQVAPTQASAVLVTYMVVFLALGAFLLRRRDVV